MADAQAKATEETGSTFQRKPMRWFHRDWQRYDAVTIKTVPRWKESYLSGDEWRFSALVEFWSKGHVVASKTVGNIEAACRYLAWFHDTAWEEQRAPESFDRSVYCDQEGCDQPHTTTYRLKGLYSRDGVKSEPAGEKHICFCDRHKRRGDCGLEDADNNYELVEPPHAS